MQGRVYEPSLIFADFELPKSIVVNVFIKGYINLNINIKDVTHLPEHQIFGKISDFAFRMNEFLQDSDRPVCRYQHWDDGVASNETQ